MEDPRSRRGHSNPYRVLGVHSGASQQDITRAYRRAAQRVHPDTQPNDPQAAAQFQILADAYDVLRDPRRRAEYNRTHLDDEPSSQAIQPRRTGSPAPWPPASPPPGQPVWAGPVHVEPPVATSQQRRSGDPPAERFEDPPIILDVPDARWNWPW